MPVDPLTGSFFTDPRTLPPDVFIPARGYGPDVPSTKALVVPQKAALMYDPSVSNGGGDMGGFLPGGFPSGGGIQWGPIFGGLGGILGDIFGDDPYTPGGFIQGGTQTSVGFPGTGMPTETFPVRIPGQVVFDQCGRCFIERTLPARTVRRRGRMVMGPTGPACLPAKPRMNVLNPRALKRALSRAGGFVKFAKKAVRLTTKIKMRKGFRAPRKKKTALACR